MNWRERLSKSLEPILRQKDPRPEISAYHDMPYAIFRYPPEEEFSVRSETLMLKTRLEQTGKRVKIISLADCMSDALAAEGETFESLGEVEKTVGIDSTIEMVHSILESYQPLDDYVANRMPENQDPLKDIVFITRAGALFPLYRTSSILEQLKGRVHVPSVLFYPGELDGAAGLKFMGILDAEHNYRPKIF